MENWCALVVFDNLVTAARLLFSNCGEVVDFQESQLLFFGCLRNRGQILKEGVCLSVCKFFPVRADPYVERLRLHGKEVSKVGFL